MLKSTECSEFQGCMNIGLQLCHEDKTPIYVHRFGLLAKGLDQAWFGSNVCKNIISHVWNLGLHLILNSLCLLDLPLHLTIYLEIVWRYSSSHTGVHSSSTPSLELQARGVAQYGHYSITSHWLPRHPLILFPLQADLMSVVQVSSITACHSLTLTAFLTSLIVSLHCLLFEGVQHLHCKNGFVIMT